VSHRNLLIYSTVDGHTRLICERMQAAMTALGQPATLVALDQAHTLELASLVPASATANIARR